MVARAGWRVSRSHLEAALSDCLAALDLARRHDDPGLAAAAHVRTGFVMQTIGRMEEALVHAERSVQLHRRFGNEHGEAFALLQEASLLHSFGRREEAAERLRTSLALCRRIGFRMGEARCGIGAGFHAMENKDYAEARRWFDRVIELSAEIRAPRFTVISHAYRGLVELLVGRPAEATADFHVALAGAQELVNTLAQGRFLSFLAMAAAELDDRAGAERMAAEAEALLAPSPMWSAVLRLQHGCLDVAQARAARRAGDLEGERRCRQAARRRAEAARAPGPGGRSLLDRSDDARLGLRVLEQAYARLDALGDGIGAGRPELEAARDGGSFRIGLGTPIELSRRASLRGIFAALLARYESAPGAPLRNEELIEAGWPGERIPRKSALNRLRVALASLREMGLHGVIVRGDNGCLIRPEVRVTWSAEQDGTERAPPSGETGSALPPSSSGALE